MADLSSSRPPDHQGYKAPPTEYTLPLRQEVFVHHPTLIGIETIEQSVLARRAALVQRSKTLLSHEEWNMYCHFGYQLHEDPTAFITLVSKETTNEKQLRLWNYYCYLRKHDGEVSPLLLSQLVEIKSFIQANHPDLYDASIESPIEPGSPPKPRRAPTDGTTTDFGLLETFVPDSNAIRISEAYCKFHSFSARLAHAENQVIVNTEWENSNKELVRDALTPDEREGYMEDLHRSTEDRAMWECHVDILYKLQAQEEAKAIFHLANGTEFDWHDEGDTRRDLRIPFNSDAEVVDETYDVLTSPEQPTNDKEDETADGGQLANDAAANDSSPDDDVTVKDSGTPSAGVSSSDDTTKGDTIEKTDTAGNSNSTGKAATTQDDDVKDNGQPIEGHSRSGVTAAASVDIQSLPVGKPTIAPLNDGHLRFNITWSPSDFDKLQKDSDECYTALTDLIYLFIKKAGVTLQQWQTDLECPDIEQINTVSVKDYINTSSIGTDRLRKAFYFSFRTSWPENGVVGLLRQGSIQKLKKEWSIQIDTSNVSAKSGETVVAGDLLMVDVNHLQRKNFDQFIRRDELPADTPFFDLKIRHRCPLKSKTRLVTVKCGKKDIASLSLIFNWVFDGEKNLEIFIPKLGLAKAKLSKADITSIYDQHRNRVKDLQAIPVPRLKNVDMERKEYSADGTIQHRSLRVWARQLKSSNGDSMEATADNGTGATMLLVPSRMATEAAAQLKLYLSSLDPPLPLHDDSMYSEAMGSASAAEEDELVRNIMKLLRRSAPKAAPIPKDNAWGKDVKVPAASPTANKSSRAQAAQPAVTNAAPVEAPSVDAVSAGAATDDAEPVDSSFAEPEQPADSARLESNVISDTADSDESEPEQSQDGIDTEAIDTEAAAEPAAVKLESPAATPVAQTAIVTPTQIVATVTEKYGKHPKSCPPALRDIISSIFAKGHELERLSHPDSPPRSTGTPTVSDDLSRLYEEMIEFESNLPHQSPTRGKVRKRDVLTPPSGHFNKRQIQDPGSPMVADTSGTTDSC